MEDNRDNFYVTLFSNASNEIYALNSQTSFTNRLAHPIDLDSSSDWEVGLSEITYKPPQRSIIQGAVLGVISALNVLITCDLIMPQTCRIIHHSSFANNCLSITKENTCFRTFIFFLWKKGVYGYTYSDVDFEPRSAYRVFE